MLNRNARGTQVLSELKSLIDAMPPGKREQVMAAIRSVLAEMAAACEDIDLPRTAQCGGAWT